MRKFNQTTHIGDLLNKTVFGDIAKGSKVSQIAKHATIFSSWNNVVGAKFAKFTKPYSIKYNKLYVSAKSPVIVQELNLYKTKIIKGINSYSKPLGIEIFDIVFNYKNYSMSVPDTLKQIEDKPEMINNEDVKNLPIDKDIEEAIKQNIDKLKFLNESQKRTFQRKMIDTYKAKNLQK